MLTTTPDPQPLPIHQALVAAARDVGDVPKSDFNQQQGFAFRGMESVMAKVGPALRKHGIAGPLPRVIDRQVETIEVGQQRKPWRLVTLTVEFTFVGPAGDYLSVVTVGEGFDPGDKASNKAMTGAMKYALVQSLTIASGHDDADASNNPDPSGARPPADVVPDGAITPIQMRSLVEHGRRLNLTAAERLAAATEVAGRPLLSARDLTEDEANDLIFRWEATPITAEVTPAS